MNDDFDFEKLIRDAASAHDAARRELSQTEAHRDYAIRQGHTHGGLSTRTIAAIAGMSHQRVAQIVAPDRTTG